MDKQQARWKAVVRRFIDELAEPSTADGDPEVDSFRELFRQHLESDEQGAAWMRRARAQVARLREAETAATGKESPPLSVPVRPAPRRVAHGIFYPREQAGEVVRLGARSPQLRREPLALSEEVRALFAAPHCMLTISRAGSAAAELECFLPRLQQAETTGSFRVVLTRTTDQGRKRDTVTRRLVPGEHTRLGPFTSVADSEAWEVTVEWDRPRGEEK